MSKSRNPVAGNAWRYNKQQVIPNKRKSFLEMIDDKIDLYYYDPEEDMGQWDEYYEG